MKQSGWDLDFATGLAGEKLVHDLLSGNMKVEVKRDMRWAETGNLYIETYCWYNNEQLYMPSGLSVTEADYWAFVLNESVFIVPTKRLQDAVISYGRYVECNIQPNPSKGFLISVRDLIAVSA